MDNLQHSHLIRIQEAAKQGRLVIFAGAGVSNNSGVPTWSDLTKELKTECGIENETDDLKIAQLYKDARGKKEYLDKVKAFLKHRHVIPNEIHRAILALKPCHIITTNYDDLFEQEIQNEYKQYSVVRKDSDIPRMSYPNSLIKMHGDFDSDNIVLTESDYYNYNKTFPLTHSFVLSLFASKLVVFVGFSFTDLNLKMILNEIQTNLQGDMQRAYLIADTKPDQLINNYYEKKGINVVYLENNDLDKIVHTASAHRQIPLSNKKGIYLYKMLLAIQMVKKDMSKDLASQLYATLSSYSDEIKVFGNGLKYFIPEKERPYWYIHSNGIQMGSSYFKTLYRKSKKKGWQKSFIKEHPDIDFKELIRIVHYNNLHEIDSLVIIREKADLHKYFDGESAASILYQLDIKRLNERLKYLSGRDLSCNIDDLEYPYVLYQLGDYYQAYLIYNSILPLAWKKQKFILYFICLYNIWSIRNGVRYQLASRTDMDGEAIFKKISEIDLSEVLSKLPVADEIRKMFQDVLSFQSIGQQAIEVEKLKEKIHQQRKSGERGGVSFNSNFEALISKFNREFSFCNDNFIICDNNRYYQSICQNTAVGILNSYATPDTKLDGTVVHTSKLDKIYPMELFILVFCLEIDTLQMIFKQYEVYSIELSQSAVDNIHRYLSNLAEIEHIPFVNTTLFSNLLLNLLFVLSKSDETAISSDLLYKVIIKYWQHLKSFRFNELILLELLNKCRPSTDALCDILDLLLKNVRFDYGYVQLLDTIAAFLQEEKINYTSFPIEILEKTDIANVIYLLYKVLDTSLKPIFYEYCLQNITDTVSFLNFIISNNFSVDFLEKFKEKTLKISCYDTDECYLLAKIYNDRQYQDLHPIIEKLSTKNKCLRYFMSPTSYTPIEEVNVKWVVHTDTAIVKEMMNNDYYKNMIKDHLKNKYLTRQQKEWCIDLL